MIKILHAKLDNSIPTKSHQLLYIISSKLKNRNQVLMNKIFVYLFHS